jgi:hypothetical protein
MFCQRWRDVDGFVGASLPRRSGWRRGERGREVAQKVSIRAGFKRQPELTPSRHEDLTPMPVSSPRRAWGWGR